MTTVSKYMVFAFQKFGFFLSTIVLPGSIEST